MSDCLQHHGLQHVRPPCPSPTPGVHPDSCPLSWWCHPTISSSVIPFSSCFRSFPASGSFQMSQLFASGCQSIGASASASVLPINFQDWFPLGDVMSFPWLCLVPGRRDAADVIKDPSQLILSWSKGRYLQVKVPQSCPTLFNPGGL